MADDRNQYDSEEGPGQGRFARKPRICAFCVDHVNEVDWKQYDLLRRFVSEQGRIKPRRQTGTCARHQRSLASAVKRARHVALLPFVGE